MSGLNITDLDAYEVLDCRGNPTLRVAIELEDGRRFDSGEIRFPRGNAKLPVDDAGLKAKFLDCAAGIGAAAAASLYERLNALGELDSVRNLVPKSVAIST